MSGQIEKADVEPQYCCLEANDPRIELICNDHAILYEQSYAWLVATRDLMQKQQAQLKFHALIDPEQSNILMLWPLVHLKIGRITQIRSVESCYSTYCMPYFDPQRNHTQLAKQLLGYVCQQASWDELRLGPYDSKGVDDAIYSLGRFHKDYSVIGHWFVDQLSDYSQYLAALPGKLRSTLKRKSKKLYGENSVEIKMALNEEDFSTMFVDYQQVYQKSWKGEEASYTFIQQICLAALKENKLRFAGMYIEGKIAAAQIWFLQNGTASIFKLAYAPEFSHYSVGSIVTAALCEHVIEQDKCHTIEFGCGNEHYKRDWMSKNSERKITQLFNSKTANGKLLIFKHIYMARIKFLFKKLLRKS